MSASEDEITEWFARQSKLTAADFPIGIGDDMAEIQLEDGTSVLVTTDMLLDGVHFNLQEVTLEQVGYKAMAVSLSDCAAMATVPVGAVVCVALPKGSGQEELKRLHEGLVLAADKFSCELVGGDITSWQGKERFAISVALLSRKSGHEPVRCGKHLEFEPRVKEAIKIVQMVTVNSMIDISDGLSSDLNRICQQSRVGAVIDAGLIPISNEAKKSKEPLSSALNDGEDFELLFTLSEKDCKRLLEQWNDPITITRIGTVTDTRKMQIRMPDGEVRNLEARGYEHLK